MKPRTKPQSQDISRTFPGTSLKMSTPLAYIGPRTDVEQLVLASEGSGRTGGWAVDERCSEAGGSGLGNALAEAAVGRSWMILHTLQQH